ncbi:alpha-protein kinase 1 [Drosophila novamexicana]|uniref:alpha-protein kinase 1 n=1 Tax=Drosophila novamexicana TaxID=47314 RepID=UPI0011E5D9BE|nr:alpha-protein kinase 1 [Drosophila novamexicana]
MSLERSKFFAGARGVETNAFYGSMTLGAGEGHGFVAHTAARARFGGVPMRQQQQLQQLQLQQQQPSSTEAAKPKVAKRRGAQPKVANTMPCTVEEFTRRAQALATGKAVGGGGGGTAGKPATSGNRRNVRGAGGAEAVAKKVNAVTSINRNRGQTGHTSTGGNDTEWSMPAKTANGSGRKPAARGRRSGRVRNETPQTKWLLLPQSNFRQCSESSSEANSPSNASQQQLRVKASWPAIGSRPSLRSQQLVETPTKSNVQSRLFTVPSQRQTMSDEPKQAQPSDHVRSMRQQQQQQQQASTTLLLQADGVKQMASVDNSRRSASSVKPSPNSNTNCSNNSFQSTLGLSGSSSSTWSNSESYEAPLALKGDNKTIKVTSTVIKIMPNAPLRIITPAPAAAPAAPAAPAVVATAATIAAPRPSTLSSINKRVPPKQPQQQQQQQKPAQQQQLPKATATAASAAAATATATGSSKIVRVDQHKVPKTIEDGIDISYQYFVSTPVARGKKPLPIRYLYRPMVRRLNQASTTTRHSRRSGGGGSSSKRGLSEGKTEEEELLEQHVQLDQVQDAVVTSAGSSDIESFDSSTELTEHNRDFDPPPIVVDAKYLPFVKQLKNHPWPQEQRRKDAVQQLQILKQQQLQQMQQQQQQLQLQHQKEEEQQQQQQTQGDQEQQLKKAKHLQMLQQQQQLIQQQRQLIEEQQQQLLAQEQQLSPRPVLIDFQPNVTRLSAVGGANICYHAPIRVCAGAVEPATVAAAEATVTATATAAAAATPEIVGAPIIAAITYEDVELNACAAKSVSFQMESDSNCNNNNNCNCNCNCNSKSNSNSNDNDNSCSQSESHNNSNNCSVCGLTAMPPKTERKRRKCKSRGKKKSRN